MSCLLRMIFRKKKLL